MSALPPLSALTLRALLLLPIDPLACLRRDRLPAFAARATQPRRLPLSPLACNAQAAATAQKKACSTFDDRKENVAPALIVPEADEPPMWWDYQ